MPIVSPVGRKSWSQRSFIWFLYITLSVFGASMAVPFLMTLTSSTSNDFDYDRFSIMPRSLWSEDDRFVKGLVGFVNRYPNWFTVLQQNFEGAPESWTSWRAIGLDKRNVAKVADYYLRAPREDWEKWQTQAGDYAEFVLSYPIEDTLATFSNEQVAQYLGGRYERTWEASHPEEARTAGRGARREAALREISEAWQVPITNFFALNFDQEIRLPLGQQSWRPPDSAKYRDFNAFREALRHGYSTPGVLKAWERFLRQRGVNASEVARLTPVPSDAGPQERALWLEFARESAPASPVIPFPVQPLWIGYLASDEARQLLGIEGSQLFDIQIYNRLANSNYLDLASTPFPLPTEGFERLLPAWNRFVETRYPLRLTAIQPKDPEVRSRYEGFLQTFPGIVNLNELLGSSYSTYEEFPLSATLPEEPALAELWIDFVRNLPGEFRTVTSSEQAYHEFLLQKYGSVDAVNAAYGWSLNLLQEARLPLDKAYAVTYVNHATAIAWAPVLSNYGTITRFLVHRGNAIPVTIWLIILTIFMTLTVNPMAAYALSRFNLRAKEKIILFTLATSAFPAMVSAIPGYLLMRDLGLLNTFYALVLPGAASGMAIFILKGFFDSLPQELFEAATIDGAKEWQIFGLITLPMVKPIMAINALNAFIAAYSGWEWALIIAQDQRMWTLSVWLYQASHWWAQTPWITTAGFVIASIPTLVVFLMCQNIILRGIAVPSMK